MEAAADVTIENCLVANNRAGPFFSGDGSGGGLMFDAPSGTLTVRQSTFSGNLAGFEGGAIENYGHILTGGGTGIPAGAMLTILDSTFTKNETSYQGGAIASYGPTTIHNSVFTGNEGRDGAALYTMTYWTGVPTTISNSSFVNNATKNGGEVFHVDGYYDRGTTLSVASSTIAGNGKEGYGVVFWGDGVVKITSTVLANNHYSICQSPPYWRLNMVNGGNNLRWPSSDTSCFGTFGDPLLGPLADNGGPTQTMALLPGSAAIDKGNCTDPNGVGLVTDQRGVYRPQAGTCDIGAYEYTGTGLAGHWPLDEGKGAVARDISGNGRDATVSTPTLAWSTKHAPAPLWNSGSYWSQKQDGFTLNAPLVTNQVDNVTFAAWVKWDGASYWGSHNFLFAQGNTGINGYGLIHHYLTDKLYLFVAGQPWFDFGYALPSSGIWVHVALVRANGTWRLYVDGVQRGGTSTMTPVPPTQGTYIGSNGWNENFVGQLDDVRFYTRALPVSEIQKLAGVLAPPSSSGCYYIKSQQTGYVLDIKGSSTAEWAPVIAWPQNATASKNQLWQITPDGYIMSRLNGYVLKMLDDTTRIGATLAVGSVSPVQLRSYLQRWILAGDGYIRNRWTDYVVDVSGESTQQGAAIIAFPRNATATPNQLWTLVPSSTCL